MLKGKVALITGSSSGIGAEIAFAFAEQGAQGITLHGRRKDAMEKTKETLLQKGLLENQIHIVLGDIRSEETRQKLIKETVACFGRIDVLVNNAGITRYMKVQDFDMNKVKDIIDTDLIAVYALTKDAIPHLTQSKGNIINISSTLSMKLVTGTLAYAATKAALDHYTKGLAVELGPSGIRANTICPGHIPETDIHRGDDDFTPEILKQIRDHITQNGPLRRTCTSRDIANGAVYFASDMASFVTGAVLPIDGGMHLT